MNSKKLSLAALISTSALILTGCATPSAPAVDAFGQATPPALSQDDAPAMAQAPDSNTPVALATDAEYSTLAHLIEQQWAADSELHINLSAAPSGALLIDQPGTYRLTGSKTDGGLVVDVAGDEPVRLILDDAAIANPDGSALAILDADGGTAIVVQAGTENSLTDGRTYADTSDDAPDAALYADDNLTIFGTGNLNIVGNFNDAINAKDGLVIDQTNLQVTAVDDAIRGKDYLVVLGGNLDVLAGDDGLKSDSVTDNTPIGQVIVSGGNIAITAGDDAITAEALVHILGGEVAVAASYEGIEAAQVIIDGGIVEVTATDDGINAASDYSTDLAVVINGGTVTVTVKDGIDSNGALLQTGGDVVIHGPTASMNGALDADRGYTVTGGTMFAVGSAGMLISPSADSTQGWLVSELTGSVSAGQSISIVTEEGAVVATLDVANGTAAVTYAGPNIVNGSSYQVIVDGAVVGTATAGVAAAGGRGPGVRGGQMSGSAQMPDGSPTSPGTVQPAVAPVANESLTLVTSKPCAFSSAGFAVSTE